MRELTKSVGSAAWALSLLGARQLGTFLSPETWMRPESAAGPFEAVGRSAREQLGSNLGPAYDTGDRLQRGLVDAVFGLLGPLDPQRWMQAGGELVSRSGDCSDCTSRGSGGWGPMPPVGRR